MWLFEFRVYLLAAIIIGATPFRSSYPPPDAKYDPDKGVWWIGLAAGVNFALFMHEWNKRRDAR